MRIVSWNVNGIRAVLKKDLIPWQVVPEADVVCLQETKAHAGQLPDAMAQPDGWHATWVAATRPGYSGVALISRQQPDQVIVGMGCQPHDDEGRVVTGIFGRVAVVGAYFTNAQDAGKRLDVKRDFCAAMERHLQHLRDQGLGTVLVGDYNIAHKPIDLARPAANEGNAGYLPEERAWMTRYTEELGYHDVYRELHPQEEGAYTWWSYRAGARQRNVGWRLDYTTVSPELRSAVRACAHHPQITGSDHCPVSIDIDLP
ncbi:MAG: exodeoxyribonuclease III [Planctomycetota bacterium]|nr:MAG: exodeoxyribonuclease III [Planctomycetota bacterium]